MQKAFNTIISELLPPAKASKVGRKQASMHQGKMILLCALVVVSVAMTANAQCVDEGKCLVV